MPAAGVVAAVSVPQLAAAADEVYANSSYPVLVLVGV